MFEPGKNRERFQILKKELENNKKCLNFKEARFISLAECESILEISKLFYQETYGIHITRVPHEIQFLYDNNQVFKNKINDISKTEYSYGDISSY